MDGTGLGAEALIAAHATPTTISERVYQHMTPGLDSQCLPWDSKLTEWNNTRKCAENGCKKCLLDLDMRLANCGADDGVTDNNPTSLDDDDKCPGDGQCGDPDCIGGEELDGSEPTSGYVNQDPSPVVSPEEVARDVSQWVQDMSGGLLRIATVDGAPGLHKVTSLEAHWDNLRNQAAQGLEDAIESVGDSIVQIQDEHTRNALYSLKWAVEHLRTLINTPNPQSQF